MTQHLLFNLARSQIGYLISSHDVLYMEKSRLVKDLELVDNRIKDKKEMLEKLEGKNDRVSFQKKCLLEYEYKGYQKKWTKVNLEIAKITLRLRNLHDVIEKKGLLSWKLKLNTEIWKVLIPKIILKMVIPRLTDLS